MAAFPKQAENGNDKVSESEIEALHGAIENLTVKLPSWQRIARELV
jgi:hypothetical protein